MLLHQAACFLRLYSQSTADMVHVKIRSIFIDVNGSWLSEVAARYGLCSSARIVEFSETTY